MQLYIYIYIYIYSEAPNPTQVFIHDFIDKKIHFVEIKQLSYFSEWFKTFGCKKGFTRLALCIENTDFMFTLGAVSGISTDQF